MSRQSRSRVRDAVVTRMAGVSSEVLATIVEQVPRYAALSPAQLSEVTAIAEWGTTRLLDLWVQDEQLADADLQRLRGIGAVRALDGRPLPGVLRAYRLAGAHVTGLVEDLGAGLLDLADAMALARLWMAAVDSLSEALAAGYDAAAGRLSGDRDRALGDLLDDLLVGRQVTRTGLADRSRELGISVDARVGLLLVEPVGTAALDRDVLDGALASVVDDPQRREIRGVRPGRQRARGLAVLPTATSDPCDLVAAHGWRGCWTTGLSVSDLPRAHRLAQHFLDHAPARAFVDRSVRHEGDAQVVAALTGQGDADPRRLAASVLGDLVSPDHRHLREGLEAFLQTGSATEAADVLGVHAQTMRYRLRRVQELTGRDARRGWDRTVLEAATVARP